MQELLRIVHEVVAVRPGLITGAVLSVYCLLWGLTAIVRQATRLVLALRYLLQAATGLPQDVRSLRRAIRSRRNDQ